MVQREGPGWRLARDPSRKNFPFLIGGEGWAIELTEKEWIDLVDLVSELVEQYKSSHSQLVPEELITLEMEKNFWWGCLKGDQKSWSLQLLLQDVEELFRGAEVFWPAPAAEAIVIEMRKMWDSYH